MRWSFMALFLELDSPTDDGKRVMLNQSSQSASLLCRLDTAARFVIVIVVGLVAIRYGARFNSLIIVWIVIVAYLFV